METWLSVLLGGGSVGSLAVTAILTGRLLPVWVVRKQMESAEATHKKSVDDLNTSHERELTALRESHAEALTQRGLENQRAFAERDYERQAKDIERGRADANAQQLAESTREFGETIVHFLRSLPGLPDDPARG